MGKHSIVLLQREHQWEASLGYSGIPTQTGYTSEEALGRLLASMKDHLPIELTYITLENKTT